MLEGDKAGADGDRTAMQRSLARGGGELRQTTEGQVDLGRGTADAKVANGGDKIVRQVLRLHKLQEGALRVGSGQDGGRIELVAVLQGDADRPPRLDDELLHTRVRANLGTGSA